ncbi:MAG: hypothetical protein AAGC96_11360 [Pseudomonadota bacterium]
MTNAQQLAAAPAGEHNAAGIMVPALVAALASAVFLIGMHMLHGTDYVGSDNDDVMRLVQVRDLMAGQGWFDLNQYRLGLDGGTLMHWSRLVDAPIALLIALFSLFVGSVQAEVAALFVWPLLLLVPLYIGIAAAGRNLGDRSGMIVALFLGLFFVLVHQRFQPGSIDHHNVQLVLIVLMMAGLTEQRRSGTWAVTAGVSAALATVIGAETMPVVAMGCISIAVLWAVMGWPARRAARYFALSFAATLTVAYLVLRPSAAGIAEACDAFSAGFFMLGTAGGAVLFFVTAQFSEKSRLYRFASLAVGGVIVAVTAYMLVPGCLQSPLANLDPMLRTMWLDHVSEARSVVAQARFGPEDLGRYYAVPVLALAVCGWQIWHGQRRWLHAMFASVIAIAFTVSLVQVRGSVFSNILAIIPLAAVIAEKQAQYRGSGRLGAAALQYALLGVFSLQLVWAMIGMMAFEGVDGMKTHATENEETAENCATADSLTLLANQPAGVVSAVSNLGSDILRHTPHRVLSAPYHRNQSGMLTQLRIAMGTPEQSELLIREAGVTILAYCPSDPESVGIRKRYPEGLYAHLEQGDVPPFLQVISDDQDAAVLLYRVVPK